LTSKAKGEKGNIAALITGCGIFLRGVLWNEKTNTDKGKTNPGAPHLSDESIVRAPKGKRKGGVTHGRSSRTNFRVFSRKAEEKGGGSKTYSIFSGQWGEEGKSVLNAPEKKDGSSLIEDCRFSQGGRGKGRGKEASGPPLGLRGGKNAFLFESVPRESLYRRQREKGGP